MSEDSNIIVSVSSEFLEHHQASTDDKYAFAYHVNIHNQSNDQVQLLSRYWLITDADGKKTEVHGDGVVGQQPLIQPDESYQYSSGAILDTPVGSMEGYYQMKQTNGQAIQVAIPVFGLAQPNLIN